MLNQNQKLTNWLNEYGPLLPLAALLATLPYTFVYFANLWNLAHYQFFPLLLVAVVYLSRQRWGGRYVEGGLLFRGLRTLLLCGGIFGTFCATLFASPWMGYFGFAFTLAAWLAYHRDRETGGSLLYLAVPILLVWQPPYNTIVTADTILIQTLQSLSSRLSSQSLDMLGYAHHQPGTILEFAGRSFGVAEACSGIQSFFAVLCFGALLVAYFRRSAIHAVLLLATCPCWAILMNTIRITSIPVAYATFGIDLSHGVLHDLLGYCTMALAMGLMLSTDELLLLVQQWLPLGQPTSGEVTDWTGAYRATTTHEEHASAPNPPNKQPTGPSIGEPLAIRQLLLTAPLLIVFAFFCGIQTYDVSESWGHERTVIDFFRDEPMIEMSSTDAPDSLLGWSQSKYSQESRANDTDDLGQRSDTWNYQAPFGSVSVSFDQMFPGWHELTRCYRNSGWIQVRRTVIEAAEADGWPIVTVEMTRENEHGFLIFSLIGRASQPLQPPSEYSYWTILEERLRGRLTPAVRGALFGVANYQMQIFAPTHAALPESDQAATVERFKQVRQVLWNAAKERL